MDPTIFPEPHKFDPDRWIRGGEQLEKYSVPFGKGSRRCIGIRYAQGRFSLNTLLWTKQLLIKLSSIAYMELYSVLAFMFSHFELELADKDQSQNGIKWADRIVARATASPQIRVVKNRWEWKWCTGIFKAHLPLEDTRSWSNFSLGRVFGAVTEKCIMRTRISAGCSSTLIF